MHSVSRCSREFNAGPAAEAVVRTTLLTPLGRGALAVIGVAGEAAVTTVSRVFVPHGAAPLADRTDGSICVGRWDFGGEEVVVVRRAVGSLEVHCHGGVAAAEAVMDGLESCGAVRQGWAEWLAAGGMAEIEIEAREAAARVGGPKAARILARQFSGCLQGELDRLGDLLASAVGKSAGPMPREAVEGLERLRRAARVGLRLTSPWRVVLAGDVNAGKSSLANALAGSPRSLVAAEPGTTRDILETRLVVDGWEIDIVDTAGLRDPDDASAVGAVEREGIARAVAAAADADLVLRVVDGRRASPTVARAAAAAGEMLVLTKSDLCRPALDTDAAAGGPVVDAEADRGGRWTSAVTGVGVDELLSSIIHRLVPEERQDPALLAGPVPFTPRQFELVERLCCAARG